MRITFLGACREVTGSNILVEAAGKKILLDCGFFQGSKMAEERNFAPFAFDPSKIDLVIIGHAHLDHTGRLPNLVRGGFGGKIFSTAPTKELTRLVLEDSEKLMFEEAKKDKHPPLYRVGDVDVVMQLFESIAYNNPLEIAPNIILTLRNAGHILGSSIVEFISEGKKLVYSGDLGNRPSELLDSPFLIEAADVVISESTYGGRIHEDKASRQQKLDEIINNTIAKDGVLMIPSFAIERTQELLHDIEHFCTENNCLIPTFFLDSPLAEKVTKVFGKYPQFLNLTVRRLHEDGHIFGLTRLKITSSVEESKMIDDASCPKIIIAGSGMLNGGRILFHLQKYIEDSKNTLLIVGYQSTGTLGRRLLEGEREIKIFGKKYSVGANVKAIGSYSAHADQPQLVDWISSIKDVEKVLLIHGEADQELALKKALALRMKAEVMIPQQGEGYEL